MNKINKLSGLDVASFFTKNTLQNVIGGNNVALSSNVARWIENGKLIQLKKGLYVTNNFLQQRTDRQVYSEFVANILKKPSYLSGEYVLQKYGVLTESVFGFTCVTRKKTREYSNKLGNYIYSNIKDSLFCGYNIINKSGFEIKEATKAKALFDYLYFKLRNVPEVNLKVIESLRLNLDNITKKDFEYLRYYINISNIQVFDTYQIIPVLTS